MRDSFRIRIREERLHVEDGVLGAHDTVPIRGLRSGSGIALWPGQAASRKALVRTDSTVSRKASSTVRRQRKPSSFSMRAPVTR